MRGRSWSCVVVRGRAPSRQTRSLQGACAKPMIPCERASRSRASRCEVALHDAAKSRVPARYVRQSQLCPQLDVSDKNVKKTQDMSDRARYVLQKM